MTAPSDDYWPAKDLEQVSVCPYCNSRERQLAFGDVQDWSFYCAPGKWNYWDCLGCQSLYLDPRPTQMSIGAAYAKYYTHSHDESVSFVRLMKDRLRNECLSQKLNANIEPRLHLPRVLNSVVAMIGKRVTVPFGWASLTGRPKGRFLDVGCGAGLTVALARDLGWDAMGLEIDPAAVSQARRSGLNILQGTYAQLSQYEGQFDCIMCSHVLEHVHGPRDLLAKLKGALKPGGVLLLILPNALSPMRRHFGANWRGLEAPRHISIPSEFHLAQLLSEAGFAVKSIAGNGFETAAESFRIERRGKELSQQDLTKARQLETRSLSATANNDLIKFVCEIDAVAPT
jgi:2-polyprenyl-3-methyl-5-hydroxy-6-metoxy-1,4-benzoquinol methylase